MVLDTSFPSSTAIKFLFLWANRLVGLRIAKIFLKVYLLHRFWTYCFLGEQIKGVAPEVIEREIITGERMIFSMGHLLSYQINQPGLVTKKVPQRKPGNRK
jgi:hypothetical protein